MTGRHAPARTKTPAPCNGATDVHWQGPDPQNYEEREQRKSSIKLETARWLDRYDWNWFATYTFAEPVSRNSAQYWFQRHYDFLEKKAGIPIYAFRADEYGAKHGRFHIHALVGNVGAIDTYCGERLDPGVFGQPCCAVHSWPCGRARVFQYDPKIKATGYVTKYVTKDEFGDYGLYGDFKTLPVPDPVPGLWENAS